MSEHWLSYKSLIFSVTLSKGIPSVRTKGNKDVLGIVQEFLLPSSNPQELHKQDFGTESLPGILEKRKGALHIFAVPLYFIFFNRI